MKSQKGLFILTLLLIGVISLGVMNSVQAQGEEDNRSGSFTTGKGTLVSLNYSLSHEGGETPLLYTDKAYDFNITISLGELGNDVNDIHDIEFILSISASTITESFLGSSTPVFSSYYFDKATSLKANQSITYNFPIFITGEINEVTDFNVVFKAREDVSNLPDPSIEYDGINYEVEIQNNPNPNPIDYNTTTFEARNQEFYTDKGTNVRIETGVSHEGLIDGKPSFLSNTLYLIQVNFTVISLGSEIGDIHDLEVGVIMEDNSITDYIPGNDAVNYFAGYAGNSSGLLTGETKTFEFTLQPNTNINDTDVTLKFEYSFREDIPNAFDSKNQYSLNIESKLNDGFSNSGLLADAANSPFDIGFALFALFIGIPLIHRRKNKREEI